MRTDQSVCTALISGRLCTHNQQTSGIRCIIWRLRYGEIQTHWNLPSKSLFGRLEASIRWIRAEEVVGR